MAELTAAERKALPDSDFAIPEQRAYPIHNESHAQDAIRMVDKNGSPDEKSRVKAAVHKRYPGIQIGGAKVPYTNVMHEFKHGDLHSGDKEGPKVKSRKQAIAIMLDEKRKAMQGDKEYQPKSGSAPSAPNKDEGMGARMARLARGKK